MANRVANCLKMLNILRSGRTFKKNELAQSLDTNLRNIIEYRKDLYDAGFDITYQNGANGGYRLNDKCLLPIINFTKNEETALLRSESTLKNNGFLHYKDFESAMIKIKAGLSNKELQHESYINMAVPKDNDLIWKYYDIFSDAINLKHKIEMKYQAVNNKTYKKYTLHPYEMVFVHGFWYLLAKDENAEKNNQYKFFKLTNRIKQVDILDKPFYYDDDFKVEDYTGKMSLINYESYDIELIAYGASAIAISEKNIGLNPVCDWLDKDKLLFKTTIEGRYNAIGLILSLGSNVKLISPKELVEEIKNIILKMHMLYDE
ncbi:MAG: WYL domain-containing protein [Bacilli bacterium]|jgi:predicted DNA-binding transcriptional regulator YafY|nr:WYL domain-containing protein [Bacilli bacterium]